MLVQLLREQGMGRVIVFTRTKHGADKLHRDLDKAGISAAAIHGNKSQNQRERALAAFKSPRPPVLIATDIAARGIDVDDVSHVVNYELPHEPETYVHRIGRTGRAGQKGEAFSFCDHEERPRLAAIERLLRTTIPHRGERPEFTELPAEPATHERRGRGPRGGGGQGGHGRRPRRSRDGRKSDRPAPRPARSKDAMPPPAAAASGGRQQRRKHRRAL
jgi:ATP-dependent RNA helicase RhlE